MLSGDDGGAQTNQKQVLDQNVEKIAMDLPNSIDID